MFACAPPGTHPEQEATTRLWVAEVNTSVADLLQIRAEMNSGALLTPSVFYHPGLLNIIAEDASRCFELPENKFFSFFIYK